MKSNSIVLIIAALVLALGVTVLAGWALDIKTLKSAYPGFITMRANTALLFVIMAFILFALRHKNPNKNKLIFAFASCIFSVFITGLTLAQYLFNKNFGIDEFLFTDPESIVRKFPPGRLAPITAINFILLSIAFIIGNLPKKKHYLASQFLVILVFFSGVQATIGYGIGMSYMFGSAFYTQMSIHTAVGFVILSIGILLSRPEDGFVKVFTTNSATSIMARRLMLAAIIAPPLTRWLSREGFRQGIFDQDFELLVQVMGTMTLTAAVVLVTTRALYEIELKRNHSLAQEKNARLEAEKAVEIRDNFLSIASHELKTPISTLLLQNQLLQRQLAKKEKMLLSFDKIKEISDRSLRQINWLANLVSDMMDVSRLNYGKIKLNMSHCDVYEILQSAVERHTEQFQQEGIEFNIHGQRVSTKCDPIQIERAFTNLISNALKYGNKKPISAEILKANQMIEIRFADQGLGILPEDQSRLFKKYERGISENEISGLGLGLYIAKEIVEAHQGFIEVKSEIAKGSVFTIKLPIV